MEPKTGVPFKVGGLLLLAICASLCAACASMVGQSQSRTDAPTPPSISAEPTNQTVTMGQSATFSITASGTPALSYQWQKNGANISGANAASYTTPPVISSDNGSTFDAVVSNSAGTVTSTAAKLTVDSATVPPSITTQPASQTVVVGQTATFAVVVTGSTPLTYQWQKSGANISGANAASYTTPPATSSDNGSTFDAVVSNSAGTVTSTAAKLTVDSAAVPPSITTQPASQTVTVGQAATFSAVAAGTMPLNYQWQKNGANISGANASSYTTPPATTADNGSTFDVVVSNSAGTATSNQANLTVSAISSNINFQSGFTTSAGLTLNGSATINGGRLRLTDESISEAGSAFFSTLTNVQSFITDFRFQLTDPNADGFAFVIQGNAPTALGSDGESLGYGTGAGSPGIGKSVAVGFQLYTGGSEVSLTGTWTNGASPGASPGRDTTSAGVNLRSGDVMTVHISYDGATLAWIITDTVTGASFALSYPVDIPSLVGGNAAYVGFTGSTDLSLAATQEIVNWTYNAVATAPFAWPVNTPVTYAASACGGPNDYATYCSQSPIFGQFHTGIDVCPPSGCPANTDPITDVVNVLASSSGVVELALVTPDPSQTLCDGSATNGYQTNTSNLGNVIVIAHPNGKFTLYGHLDCIWPGIVPGLALDAGTTIGYMGHSGSGQRNRTFTPHTHFELKDRGVTGDPTNQGYSGYTTDVPAGYGYQDARIDLNPFVATVVAPTTVKVVASAAQSVRTGPDVTFASLTTIAPNQEFVASATSGSWYRIDLPNAAGPVSGWVEASAGTQTFLSVDSSATQIQVSGGSQSGVDVQAGSSSSPDLVNWDYAHSGTCSKAAKVWNGQWYVLVTSQNGFDEFYLPLNYYFSSASSCAEPTSSGPSTGWAASSFLQ